MTSIDGHGCLISWFWFDVIIMGDSAKGVSGILLQTDLNNSNESSLITVYEAHIIRDYCSHFNHSIP